MAALVLASARPIPAPERIVRIELVPTIGDGAPAAAASAPEPAPEPERRPPAPKPPPRAARVARPAPRVTKPVVAASPPAPEPPAAPDGAVADGAGIDVASAPPAAANGAGSGPGARPGAARGGGDEIAVYLARIHELLSRYQRYPTMARRRGLEGSVLLELRIGADGRIERATTRAGSPQLFARSALDAVERAGRFPAPPGGALAIEVPLRFELDD